MNIIEETVSFLHKSGTKKFGLLATDGTVRSGSYDRVCAQYGMTCVTPDGEGQAAVMSIIYDSIKQNKPVDLDALLQVADQLRKMGCERIVLGCTELSLLNKSHRLDDFIFLDSLEVLAYKTILSCQKEPIGFPKSFDRKEEHV